MSDIKKSKSAGSQVVNDELDALLEEAKRVGEEVEATAKESKHALDALEKKIDSTIGSIREIHAELDKADKEAGDALDKLAMEEAVDLADKE